MGVDAVMQRLNAEADRTLRRIKQYAVREELKMGDDIGDSGTLPTTIPDLLQRVLQRFGKLPPPAVQKSGQSERARHC